MSVPEDRALEQRRPRVSSLGEWAEDSVAVEGGILEGFPEVVATVAAAEEEGIGDHELLEHQKQEIRGTPPSDWRDHVA
jgi:hypothetical protein